MTSGGAIVPLRQRDSIEGPLTLVLRDGARRLLAQAIEAEAETFPCEMEGLRLPDGRGRVARHGHGPERLEQTGIGAVAVERVKLRGRGAGEAGAERVRFTSAIPPRWPGGRAASMPCCPSSTCAAPPWVASKKPSRPCWERTPRTFRRRWSRGCSGTRHRRAAAEAKPAPAAPPPSGPLASNRRHGY